MRKYILISLPDTFAQKFVDFVHNVNAVNADTDPPIVIEKVYDNMAATPKEREGSGKD